jgi:hypothetical protein
MCDALELKSAIRSGLLASQQAAWTPVGLCLAYRLGELIVWLAPG